VGRGGGGRGGGVVILDQLRVLANGFRGDIFALYTPVRCRDSSVVRKQSSVKLHVIVLNTRVGTLIVATIYLQLIQNRYMFRSLLSFSVVTSIVYNPLPAMWKS